MSYDSRERSAADGRPVELYTFMRESIAWRYTSANRDQAAEFQTFKAVPGLSRGAIEQGSEAARAALRITAPRDLEVVELYRVSPPSDAIAFTLRQFHAGDGELVTVWTGRIASVTPWKNGSAEIILEPTYSAMRRNGLRRLYQRQCPHVLYGPACRAVANAYRVTASPTEVTGVNVVAAAFAGFPDGYFAGGYLEWAIAAGVFERRFIFAHAGASLELSTIPLGLAAGMSVNVYPGCDHALATCHDKFNNAPNYGGQPYIPQKNPFGSDPIY